LGSCAKDFDSKQKNGKNDYGRDEKPEKKLPPLYLGGGKGGRGEGVKRIN